MRVTNMMLTNNSLINMGKSKERFLEALEQHTTEKKILRPSDNPVIAVRALKYRTNLYELNQYLSRNIKEAYSWMDVTEKAMEQINGMFTKIYGLCNEGSTGTYELEDFNSMIEELKQVKDFIYEQQLNTDFAGRYVFAGYRTDTPMLFESLTTDYQYQITEKHEPADLVSFSYVYGGAEYGDGKDADAYAGEAPDMLSGHKLTLAYSNLDNDNIELAYIDDAGTPQTISVTTKSIHDNDAYKVGSEDVHFIHETGELVFGDKVYENVLKLSGFTVTYNKSEFDKGDIKPEHYFDCTVTKMNNGVPDTTTSKKYLNPDQQNINYEINFSQSLTVNTLGCNLIDHGIGRMVEELENAALSLQQTMNQLGAAKKRLEDADPNDTDGIEALNKLIEQIETEKKLKENILQDLFASGLTKTTKMEQKVNIAIANHGARYTRLQMTESKLEDQKIQFTEIMSENEDVDLGEALIKYNQADLLYQAALSATSKLLGNSLLNFI